MQLGWLNAGLFPERKSSPKSATVKPNVDISIADYKPVAKDSINKSNIRKYEDNQSDTDSDSMSPIM